MAKELQFGDDWNYLAPACYKSTMKSGERSAQWQSSEK